MMKRNKRDYFRLFKFLMLQVLDDRCHFFRYFFTAKLSLINPVTVVVV